MAAARFDVGESDICGLRAMRGKASHKPSIRKWQRAQALGADTKRFSRFWLESIDYLTLDILRYSLYPRWRGRRKTDKTARQGIFYYSARHPCGPKPLYFAPLAPWREMILQTMRSLLLANPVSGNKDRYNRH